VAAHLQAVLPFRCFSFFPTQFCILQQGGSACLPNAPYSCQTGSSFSFIHSMLSDRASCKSYLKYISVMFLELILNELWGPCWLQIPLSQANLQYISPGQAFPYPRTRPDRFLSLFLFFVLLFSCF